VGAEPRLADDVLAVVGERRFDRGGLLGELARPERRLARLKASIRSLLRRSTSASALISSSGVNVFPE
jgi:hypothetical protein